MGNGFLGIKGRWENAQADCFIVNIYSPCDIAGKRRLWEESKDLRASNMNCAWCLGGDFNAVRSASERKGAAIQIPIREMADFDEFIDDMGMNDLPLIGRKYTWHRPNGRSMSRIDRFLVSDEWLSMWPNISQWGLERSVSDHCAIVLKSITKDWGPKLFRIMNCWLEHTDFDKVVKENWLQMNIHYGVGIIRA